ncbi:VOC family protein [Naasia aerilata]|uniref:Glyoxalase n=1 Tax=Naasia aerilata TaxID=1162966 RepID=A0ABN6XIS1_9MICO|nr:VOC family protein [Naasia aerilata]BDZ44787.1 glyoxalase [Naasia aerilata]
MTLIFISLPVTDLERSKAFYTAIGGTVNPAFTDHNAACMILEEDHSYFMLVTREFFQTMSDLPIGDPAVNPTTSVSLFFDSREEVDAVAEKALAAGGAEPRSAADYGFMYQRGINDPDGNPLEFGYMDPVAAAQGPEAYAAQHQG